MKNTFFLIPVILISSIFFSFTEPPEENIYSYNVDLREVSDDKVTVELVVPYIDKNSIEFHMPKIIPGTYTIYDFGRFVSSFTALDKNGELLPVTQKDVNTWKIKNAKSLYKIVYKVDDTYDATGGKSVAGMSGTNIEDGKNFLLNGHGFFGYFEGMKSLPVKLKISKPEGFVASSAYVEHIASPDSDQFIAKDYHYLLDMPIMFNKPDTSLIKLGDTEVLISVYSPNGLVTSEFLKEQFTELLYSQEEYLGGDLPVRRYAFIMYFMSDPLPIGTGALEHSYSSVYCLPEIDQERIAPFLVDIASHEFFHIITPLNVHSEEIHYFDFNNPDMSRHLWMYEGITEYFSHHNQVKSGMISKQEYLDRMGEKIQNSKSNYTDDLAFTKLSKYCLGKHEHEYGNVYQKGALIGMCLDIELLQLSNGKYGVVNLMEDLSEEFGSNQPFKDKKLFKEIENLTYPEIGDFLKKYVDGNNPLPYGEFFNKAGIGYSPPKDTLVYSFGDVNLSYNSETQRLVVAGTYNLNTMGRLLDYRVGDELISIQGKEIPQTQIQSFFQEIKSNMKEGEMLRINVARKDSNGEENIVELFAPIQKAKRTLEPSIYLSEDISADQKLVRDAWLGE